MSSTIDNRIVKMQMENSQFTSAAKATMGTLSKLSSSLKFTEGTKGLDNIAKSVKNVDMSGLETGIDSVSKKFSAMDIVGVTALVNISNSAINAGMNLIKSLTLDPVMDGLSEYEIKMGAIQTIMTNTASKGTSLDDINEALWQLNEYSDKTIYNFAQMTDNIGKATAAGVGLEDSVTFVKGLANVAAGFGVDATAMAGATQQMTQALASGTIRLQDWMSMENRGMGGEMLQNALYQTAEEMGIYVDKSKSFRYTLDQNWLSSEVFIKTMEKMANDESLTKAATQVKTFTQLISTMKENVGSGWAMSWEWILGDKNQSTELFTSISDAFRVLSNSMADYRNQALETWNKTGGREAVLNGLKNILASIGNLLGPIYNAFKKIIDPWNGERLVSLSKSFEKLTEKLKVSDKTAGYIQKTFEGLFSIFKLVGVVLQPIGSLFMGISGGGSTLVETFFKLTSALTGWIPKATEFLESSGWMQKAMKIMGDVGESVAEIFNALFTSTSDFLTVAIGYAELYIGKFVSMMGDVFMNGKTYISNIVQWVKDFNEAYQPLTKVKDFILGIFDAIQNGVSGFVKFIGDGLKSIQNFFTSIIDKIKESNVQGIDLVNAGLFAAIIVIIKKVIGLVKNVLTSVGDFKTGALEVLDALKGTLESYQKDIKGEIIKKIAISIALLAGSLFLISKIDPERLLPAITSLGALMGGLVAALWAFNKIDPKELKKSTSTIISLIGIAIAVNILASAMRKLSKLEWDGILKSIVGLTAACVAVLALVKTIDGAKINPDQGVTMILLATSLYSLAGAMALLGLLNIGDILKSIVTIGIVMAGIKVFLKSTSGITGSIEIALSLIPLANAMILLAGALALFGNMNIGTLTQGFIVLTLALTELSLFTNSMRGFKGNMLSIGGGILILSGALIILSGALGILGNMKISTLAQGLIAMSLSLTLIGSALRVMPKNATLQAVSISILASSMLLLALGLGALGSLSIPTIAKGLGALAGVLLVFGGASLVLTPAVPVMGLLALALLGLGAACGLVGGGLLLLSTGLAAFSGSAIAGSLALIAVLTSVASTIPIFASAVALGFVSFLTILGYNAVAIQRALTQLLGALLRTIIENTPLFVEAVVTFLMNIMDAIITMAPKVAETIVTLVMTVMEVLTTNLPLIANMVMEFLAEMMFTVLTNLANSIPKIGGAITDIIIAIIDTIGTNVPRVVNAIYDLIINMINGLADAVETKMPQVRQAVKRLTTAIIDEFKACIKDAISIGGNIVQGMANGISNGIQWVIDAAKNVANSALNTVKNLLGIHSPARKFIELGKYSDQGFANGLERYSGLVTKQASGVAETALSGMRAAMSCVDDILSTDDSGPVIRPVLDLSEIQNGSDELDSMLDKESNIFSSITSSRRSARSIGTSYPSNNSNGNTTENTTNNTTEITNHFTITSNNPKETADEVSRRIQKDIERRDLAWG